VNWRYVYFVRPLEYLIKKFPVPTKRATTSSIRVKSWSSLFPMLLVCIRSYLKSVLSYKFLILNYYNPDSLHLHEEGWDIRVYFSKPNEFLEKKTEWGTLE
jgi:hypothetical protein